MGEGVLTAAPTARAGAALADPAGLFADAGLARVGGALHLGGVPLEEIAREVGTPAYVYNAAAMRERFHQLAHALRDVPHRLCYSVKSNSTLAVLRLMRDLGAGADIVSQGEMARALAAGFAPSHIVFSGVGKTAEELRAAIRAGVGHLNVESREELAALAEVAREEGKRTAVGLRVNPDVLAETHPYISTGKRGDKFGIPLDQVLDAARTVAAHPHLELSALAMHIGSQIADPAPFGEALRRMLGLLGEIRAAGIDTVRVLDIGGGFAIRYKEESAPDVQAFAATIVPLLRASGLTIFLEPGRFLVGSAGILLSRVLYRKVSGGKTFIVGDAAMNDLYRPSHYGAHHEIAAVQARAGAPVTADLVGPVCETGDFLALDRALPPVEPGDLLAVLCAGAYGFSMASQYNGRPRPPEVMVDGGRFWVARARETVTDLMRGERAAPDEPTVA